MSKSFKYLLKQAELAKVAKVANPKTETAKSGGGEGVAANPGALKIELINPPRIFAQTNGAEQLSPTPPAASDDTVAATPVTQEPPAARPSPFEAPEVATVSIDTLLAQEPLESKGTAVGKGPGVETVAAEPESIQAPQVLKPEGVQAPKAEDSAGVQAPKVTAETSASWQARVYAKPLNPRMRLIEFITGPRVGEHGQLWVKDETQIMLNWRVWVKPDVNRPNPPGLHWVMDGQYNWRGIRVK